MKAQNIEEKGLLNMLKLLYAFILIIMTFLKHVQRLLGTCK